MYHVCAARNGSCTRGVSLRAVPMAGLAAADVPPVESLSQLIVALRKGLFGVLFLSACCARGGTGRGVTRGRAVNKKTTPAPPAFIIAQLTIQLFQRLGYPLNLEEGVHWSSHAISWLKSLTHAFTVATLDAMSGPRVFMSVFAVCFLWLATNLAIVLWASWSFHQNRFAVTWPLKVLSFGAKVSGGTLCSRRCRRACCASLRACKL
jgi:hypothetical protein